MVRLKTLYAVCNVDDVSASGYKSGLQYFTFLSKKKELTESASAMSTVAGHCSGF